jgi:hypothetical protein
MRFVTYKDRKPVAKAMREMYTASTLEAAELALGEFRKLYSTQYPGAVDVWDHAWNDFVPFLDYPVELRKVDRIDQLPAPENHQESWSFPRQGRRSETSLPRVAEYLQSARR